MIYIYIYIYIIALHHYQWVGCNQRIRPQKPPCFPVPSCTHMVHHCFDQS